MKKCWVLGAGCWVLCLALVAACGSKGPPLPPLRLAPARAEGLSAMRVEGGPITLRFSLPATNDNGTAPPDLGSVRIYAVTKPAGEAPPGAADFAAGNLQIASLDVRAVQGPVLTWEDTTQSAASYPTPMVRYYAVAGASRRGRLGALSPVVAVPLTAVPGAPSKLSASFTDKVIRLDWLGASADTRYRIYEVVNGRVAGTPLNPEPVAGTSFEDTRLEFGTERCYIVRSAIASTGASIESAAAGPVCITPRDIFPPPAPANLTAVAGTGVMSLIWDAVDVPDLAGYLVLRAAAPGEKLQPLFETPITDTTYKDTTTAAGTRYVYAVVAVDKASNRSAESNRVEETGRQ